MEKEREGREREREGERERQMGGVVNISKSIKPSVQLYTAIKHTHTHTRTQMD